MDNNQFKQRIEAVFTILDATEPLDKRSEALQLLCKTSNDDGFVDGYFQGILRGKLEAIADLRKSLKAEGLL